MSDGVYEHDLLVWSEQQADLLERLVAGEPVNEGLDWPNLIEEVEGFGPARAEIVQKLVHAHSSTC